MSTIKKIAIVNEFGSMEGISSGITTAILSLKDTQLLFDDPANLMYFTGGQDLYQSVFANMKVYQSYNGGGEWESFGNTGRLSTYEFIYSSIIYNNNIYAITIDPSPFHVYFRKFTVATKTWSTIATDPLGAGNVGKITYINGDFYIFGYYKITSSFYVTNYYPNTLASFDIGITWDAYENNNTQPGAGAKFIDEGASYAYLLGAVINQTDKIIEETGVVSKDVFATNDYGDWTTLTFLTTLKIPSDIKSYRVEEITIDGKRYITLFNCLNYDCSINPNMYLWEIKSDTYNIFANDPIVYTFFRNTPPLKCASVFAFNHWFIAGGATNTQLTVCTNVLSLISFKTIDIKTTFQSDYESKIYGRLLNQYDNALNLKNLLKAYVIDPVQDLEQSFFEIYHVLDIDLEFGAQLDLIGKIIGLARKGTSDWEYKILLKCRIAANSCDGTHQNFNKLLIWLTGSEDSYTEDDFPAKIFLNAVVFPVDKIKDKIIKELEKAVPCGVGITALYITL